jgi:hypothetical protein
MKRYCIIVGLVILSVGIAGWYYWQHNIPISQETLQSKPQPLKVPVSISDISLSPLSICKALDTALEFLNMLPDQMLPINEAQRTFLSSDYAAYRQHIKKDMFTSHELQAYVAHDAETLNKILRDNGFSIQLEDFSGPDSIGVVAIQNILVKWIEKAERKSIRSGNKEYPGFHLDEQFHLDTHKMSVSFSGNDQNNPTLVISEIATQSGDKVYCAVKVKIGDEKTTVTPFFQGKDMPHDDEIMQAIDALKKEFKDSEKYPSLHRYNALELPMINYHEKPSIEWLLRLKFPPNREIAQALQEVIFKMNETGAQSKAAVAIEICETMSMYPSPPPPPKEPLIVNQPFLLWIERPGMPLPIFAAYLEQKYWADPGSLEIKQGT